MCTRTEILQYEKREYFVGEYFVFGSFSVSIRTLKKKHIRKREGILALILPIGWKFVRRRRQVNTMK